MAGPRSLNPTCEDYNSDDGDDAADYSGSDPNDPVLEAFRRSPAANVAAKRSHPSELGTDASPADKVVHADLQSDSGYSTAALSHASSADSTPSGPTSAPPPPPSPAVKRRPTLSDDRKNSSQSSPRKPLQRSGSVSSRRPRERRQTVTTEDCTDPNCTKCGPNALPSSRGRRPDPSPLDSGLDVSYPPFDQRSQRLDPAPSYVSSPQSPTYNRPGPYLQGSAIVQPAQSARRRSSSTQRPARPVSYHAGDPGNGFWAPGMPYSNTLQDLRGPPPSMSAFTNMHHPPPQMAPYMPSAPNYYNPGLGHPMQTPPQYDVQPQRPQMSSRNSSNYHTRGRPVSGYGPTLVTHEQNPGAMPSARYAPTQNPRQDRYARDEPESESSECESSDEEEAPPRNLRNGRIDRALMPPPPPPPSKTPTPRRPSLRHAATTQVYNSGMSQSQTLPERPRERDPRDSRSTRGSNAAPSRASSISRPALIQHPKAQSAFESARNAQVVVENSRSRRRQSYQSYDKQYEAEEKRRANRNSRIFPADGNRASKMYQDDGNRKPNSTADSGNRSSKIFANDSNRNSRIFAEDAIVPARVSRRQTDSDVRRREEMVAEKNIRATLDADAYIRSTRGSNDPLIEKVHMAAKRASRVPSGPSEAESSRSKGSDKASRMSLSNRTTVTNGGGSGEIRLRVDASAPLSLSFNGDMEGRTLHINPTDDGMADIVIGNPGRENVYSERGSIYGSKAPKAIMARRDAEDSSVRSERSSHTNRRDGERRVLQRRRRDLEYN
ncbi:hypothetical protein K505DRAFT_368868 [Melanomma pulvis-pyrius CBS 109.77]|uniref:Uncharacterized protein n=1 Tax=Melanomma pulvis-pyrius CBS 109.77 TaxID=1314802 RepID=A0A6A6WNP2_9PLEO|nr:hypothetical protein K505DRAFT_368868 [Melanomma pulvis-pyrius CBS 109.77]